MFRTDFFSYFLYYIDALRQFSAPIFHRNINDNKAWISFSFSSTRNHTGRERQATFSFKERRHKATLHPSEIRRHDFNKKNKQRKWIMDITGTFACSQVFQIKEYSKIFNESGNLGFLYFLFFCYYPFVSTLCKIT